MAEGELRPIVVGEGLSGLARTAWAKHDRDGGGWLPLWRHMADSGSVAGLLWDRWVPEQARRVISQALPDRAEDARRLVVWLATTHDIGKATPAFACQVDDLAKAMRDAGLETPGLKEMLDRKSGPHGLAGMLLLKEWLGERYGWDQRDAWPYAIVAGGHHGVPPANDAITALVQRPALLRTPGCEAVWRDVQWELLDACAEACGVAERLTAWRGVRLPQPAQVLLTGLVIVSDWIASNPDLFPYFPQAAGTSDRERVEAAWRGLDLPAPWEPCEPGAEPAAMFASRFILPPGARIRPVQDGAVRLARRMTGPGLMIIEAPMGEGKTEAALAVAEVFAVRSGAGGCYVALPTMATSNALFSRMLAWLRRLPGSTSDGRFSVLLAHGKAALNEDYGGLLRAGFRTVRAVEPDGRKRAGERWQASATLVAHRWLRGRKKGMLASFAVGTIDQLLFMGLKSRHLALRHLALAGKVVVIDEAHAYDTYMNSYLDRVLSWLGEYGVPVVVLSATLPAARRRDLVRAYAGEGGFGAVAEASAYPLITTVDRGGGAHCVPVAASGRRTEVRLEQLSDDLEVLSDRLVRELAGGGCALVVRNTVDRVLETATHLRERFPDAEVMVAHARFLDLDRAAKDKKLLDLFGPPERAGDARPSGPCIVVASQVAEQSLDIDFDLLVSDLCPVDLLIQRMGRLHRHQRGVEQSDRPERLRTARCLVTGADWESSPVAPVTVSQRIYQRYALLRAAAVLQPYLSSPGEVGRAVRLPDDISPLVQEAYGEGEVGPAAWQEAMDEARRAAERRRIKQEEKALDFQINPVSPGGKALIGWVDAGVGDADDSPTGRAQVRDSTDSLEVLVVQRFADGTVRTVPWLDGGRGGLEVPTDVAPEPRLGRVIASCGLRLPLRLSNPGLIDRVIAELEAECFEAWQAPECHWLAGELILLLDEKCRTRLAGFELSYSEDDGLEVARGA